MREESYLSPRDYGDVQLLFKLTQSLEFDGSVSVEINKLDLVRAIYPFIVIHLHVGGWIKSRTTSTRGLELVFLCEK